MFDFSSRGIEDASKDVYFQSGASKEVYMTVSDTTILADNSDTPLMFNYTSSDQRIFYVGSGGT